MAKGNPTTPFSWGIYAERNTAVRSIGMSSYDEYLASPLWASIRSRILDGAECYACGHTPTQVHHSRYTKQTLIGRDDSNLFALCGVCHQWAHSKNGKHLAPDKATSRLRARRDVFVNGSRLSRRLGKKYKRWCRNQERRLRRSPLPANGSVVELLATSFKPMPLYAQFLARIEREA